MRGKAKTAPARCPFSPLFVGGGLGVPPKIEDRKKGYPDSNLSTGGPSLGSTPLFYCGCFKQQRPAPRNLLVFFSFLVVSGFFLEKQIQVCGMWTTVKLRVFVGKFGGDSPVWLGKLCFDCQKPAALKVRGCQPEDPVPRSRQNRYREDELTV